MKHEPFNESTEMYLKTVHELVAGEDTLPISALAQRLGVSTVSATEMVHRLQDQGLLEHLPYRGIRLTVEGDRRAAQIVRSHQLWEVFLFEQLQLPWERVHEVACRLEHATDGDVTEALDGFLGHPTNCPHGNPVPNGQRLTEEPGGMPLSEVRPGTTVWIKAIHPESTLLLEHLAEQDLKTGQMMTLIEIAPFNGPFMVKVGESKHAIGQEVAAHIFVTVETE